MRDTNIRLFGFRGLFETSSSMSNLFRSSNINMNVIVPEGVLYIGPNLDNYYYHDDIQALKSIELPNTLLEIRF